MNDLQKMALEKAIDEQFAERMDWINEAIFNGCLDTDSAEKIYTQMIVNGINIATKMAVALAFDLLEEVGVWVPYSEDEIRKRIFSIVKE